MLGEYDRVHGTNAAAFGEFIEAETRKRGEVIREAGLKGE